MKNTKLWSLVLAIITIVTLILDTVNLEPFGINVETVSKISGVLTIIKLIYDNRHLFTAQDVADFANEGEYMTAKRNTGRTTVNDVLEWRKNRS